MKLALLYLSILILGTPKEIKFTELPFVQEDKTYRISDNCKFYLNGKEISRKEFHSKDRNVIKIEADSRKEIVEMWADD